MAQIKEKLHLLQGEGTEVAGELQASCLSRYTLWWIVKTLRKGYTQQLDSKDIYEILPDFAAEENATRIRERPASTNGITVARHICKAFPLETAKLLVLFLLAEVCRLSQPTLVRLFMDYLNYKTISNELGYTYAFLLLFSTTCLVYLERISYYQGELFGVKLRSAYSNFIYQKVLVSPQQKVKAEEVVNLLSTDVERVCDSFFTCFDGFCSAFKVVIVATLLIYEVGYIAMVALCIYAICLIISLVLSVKLASMRLAIASATEFRIKMMNEFAAAVRLIKMYCWEDMFYDAVTKARKKEMRIVMNSYVLQAVASAMPDAAEMLGTACILVTSYATGNKLSAAVFFTTMLYCYMLRAGTIMIPRVVRRFGQTVKSLHRIENFLLEKKAYHVKTSKIHRGSSSRSLEMDQAWASWDEVPNDHTSHLRNLTVACDKGALVAVIGPVGAGKTSMLMLLADDMPLTNGHVCLDGKLSYCSQTPWVFHGTIRENILFGQKMNSLRFREVLSVCCLDNDLNAMPSGELTLIGEKGFTLSEGQRARITLARAVYRDADVYLIDDPFSALDAKVGRYIFKSCIQAFLKDKTRVLATHHTQYLSGVDAIILLEKEEVRYFGSYQALPSNIPNMFPKLQTTQGVTENPKAHVDDLRFQSLSDDDMDMNKDAQTNVGLGVYLKYIQAGGIALFLAGIGVIVITEGLAASAQWHMSEWSKEAEVPRNSSVPASGREDKLIHTYAVLAVISAMVYIVDEVPLFIFLALAARRLHDSMFLKVLRAPTRFYDINPIGIMLNRFTRDMGFVDLFMPTAFHLLVGRAINCCRRLTVSCLIQPWLTVIAIPTLCVIYQVYRFGMKASRQLKSLETAARSPVYSHLSETLRGLQTIRIMDRKTDFHSTFVQSQDDHTMRWLMYLTGYRWIGLTISSVLLILLYFAVVLALVLDIPASFAGLCITQLLVLFSPFENTFRNAGLVENYMTSVERILRYSKLDQEAPAVCENRPPRNWPEAGRIQLEHLSLYYYEGGPAALQDINVDIQPGERIGIVGRTGSGKTSILHSLLRLTEPNGRIFIDGIDTKSIGLRDLRNQISVVPQDPVLFSGTIRSNLDPFGSFSEESLWNVLQKVQLADKVKRMCRGLDANVNQMGSNLSCGQRQLICLARALLRKSKLVVLDEATANIDQEADRIIQAIIRVHFLRCTVLIIAHRLDTVMDCNKIMVLDQGKLKQYGVPYLLLQESDGMLLKYVQETGPEQAEVLHEIALEAYVNRLN